MTELQCLESFMTFPKEKINYESNCELDSAQWPNISMCCWILTILLSFSEKSNYPPIYSKNQKFRFWYLPIRKYYK